MFSFNHNHERADGSAWFARLRERVTLNVETAIALGDELFEQAKENRSSSMIEWTRHAADHQGPRPNVSGVTGVCDAPAERIHLVPLLYNEISEEDFLLDTDPSQP